MTTIYGAPAQPDTNTSDLTKPPFVDEQGNPTPANPNYMAWKAKQDMDSQTSVNGANKAVPHK